MNVFRVFLSEKAIEIIEEEIIYTAVDYPDGVVECGGWLWSAQDSNWFIDGLEVVEASGPGPGAVKTYDTMVLPTDYLLEMDELFRRDGLELCGRWHIHHGGSDQPSEADLNSFGQIIGTRAIWGARTPRALELILTRPSCHEPWIATPWILRRGSGGILGSPGVWPEAAVLISKGE